MLPLLNISECHMIPDMILLVYLTVNGVVTTVSVSWRQLSSQPPRGRESCPPVVNSNWFFFMPGRLLRIWYCTSSDVYS